MQAQQFSAEPAHAPAFQRSAQSPSIQRPPQPPVDQQSDQSNSSEQGSVLHLGVNEVNLIFTVTDKHSHYIPNLKQSDFALLDDQKAPTKITSFHQQINLPLRVGIVIDASTSIRSRFQFEQQSATEFLLQILKAKDDRAFVINYPVGSLFDVFGIGDQLAKWVLEIGQKSIETGDPDGHISYPPALIYSSAWCN
jgi:Ca-activated chloride channel family protein